MVFVDAIWLGRNRNRTITCLSQVPPRNVAIEVAARARQLFTDPDLPIVSYSAEMKERTGLRLMLQTCGSIDAVFTLDELMRHGDHIAAGDLRTALPPPEPSELTALGVGTSARLHLAFQAAQANPGAWALVNSNDREPTELGSRRISTRQFITSSLMRSLLDTTGGYKHGVAVIRDLADLPDPYVHRVTPNRLCGQPTCPCSQRAPRTHL